MSEEESGAYRQHPPGKADSRSCWSKLLPFVILAVLLGCFVLAALPVIFSCKGCGHGSARTVRNAKQVGYALFNFESDYGHYPNDETAKELLEKYDVDFLSSTGGSNFYFSQLIAGGYMDQEGPFHVNGVNVEPDNNQSDPEELLKSGEVGFAYVMWESRAGIPERGPLVIAYLEPGELRLPPKKWLSNKSRRMVVLNDDMSVMVYRASRDGTVEYNGKDYFDWSQSHWGGQKPKIVWPE